MLKAYWLVILISINFSGCDRNQIEQARTEARLAREEADRASAKAEIAETNAQISRVEAERAKAEADNAKAHSNKAQIAANLAQREAEQVQRSINQIAAPNAFPELPVQVAVTSPIRATARVEVPLGFTTGNIRAEPSQFSALVGKVIAGREVDIVGAAKNDLDPQKSGEWFPVKYIDPDNNEELRGWMHEDILKFNP